MSWQNWTVPWITIRFPRGHQRHVLLPSVHVCGKALSPFPLLLCIHDMWHCDASEGASVTLLQRFIDQQVAVICLHTKNLAQGKREKV